MDVFLTNCAVAIKKKKYLCHTVFYVDEGDYVSYLLTTPSLESYVLNALYFKYRSRFDIALDILDRIMKEPRGKTKTDIKEDSRLSYEQLNKYIDLLLLCDFIAGKNSRYGDRQVTRYILTEQGLELVKKLQALYFTWALIQKSPLET